MARRLALDFVALSLCSTAHALQALPVLRASSASVDVQDGNVLRRGYWTASPAVALDVYYARRSTAPKRITFHSDVDSLSFDVAPGQSHDFLILLDDKEECRTRISTLRESCRSERGSGALHESIPFEIGADHKIHIQGRINGSAPLDLMFDTGADNVVPYASGLSKVSKIEFDGAVENSGLGGRSKRRTSNDNRLDIANLRWDHELVMHIDNAADSADGIVGYNVLEDKIVEIDYDRMELRIHDELPDSMHGFSKHEMRFDGTLTTIETTLIGDGKSSTEWLILDTGASGSLHLSHALAARHGLPGSLERLGTSRSGGVGPSTVENDVVSFPVVRIGDRALEHVPAHVVSDALGDHVATGLVGMDVLERFNTVIDYQRNEIYFKPSTLWSVPFRKDYSTVRGQVLVIVSALLFLACAAIVMIRRKRRVHMWRAIRPR